MGSMGAMGSGLLERWTVDRDKPDAGCRAGLGGFLCTAMGLLLSVNCRFLLIPLLLWLYSLVTSCICGITFQRLQFLKSRCSTIVTELLCFRICVWRS